MSILELMRSRHSVRAYLDKPIEDDKKNALNELIAALNADYGTNVQIFFDDETAFKNATASYGNFQGCKNYAALVGSDPVTAGYVGEILALKAQSLGLNSCFVALTYNKGVVKSKISLKKGEKLQCSLALGYGKTQGTPRKSKTREQVLDVRGEVPDNLEQIVEACLLAPTAINQQKFKIICENGDVEIKKSGLGFYTDFDLGIIKCHKDLITEKITL